MLLHQAVRGFALWFGKKPEVTPQLRALVEADLGPSAAQSRRNNVASFGVSKPSRRGMMPAA